MDIIRFKGGLGNQMFQYAFGKSLEIRNRVVGYSTGFYDDFPNSRRFDLLNAFGNIELNLGYDDVFKVTLDRWRNLADKKMSYKERFFWDEKEEEYGVFNKNVYETENCVFSGYWQSYLYFEELRSELIKDFELKIFSEEVKKMYDTINVSENYVSIHIRRGDYLKFDEIYGQICTSSYYKNAISYCKKTMKAPRFIVFSDDINWAEQNLCIEDAIYFRGENYKQYNFWDDMALMSVCNTNIIANSTFSWWGAWLNQKENHIVIAPRIWANPYPFCDICPDSWLRL